MSESGFPSLSAGRADLEHPVAAPENARRLLERLPDRPGALDGLKMRHVVSARDFDPELLLQLFRRAAGYEVEPQSRGDVLRCKVLSNLFLDRSHCTGRLSFNSAWMRLGGQVLDFEGPVDAIIGRRYAPDEIVEICNNFSDLTVLRTRDPATMEEMLPRFRIPLISAGDGANEHPTHALCDLYTLMKWRPQLIDDNPPAGDRLQIALVGDPGRTRTLRSFLLLLSKFPRAVERVVLMQRLQPAFADGQREELSAAGLRIETVPELFPTETDMEVVRRLMPEMDVVYVHHLEQTHVPRMAIVESVSLLKSDAMILNPEIQNEEAANRINHSPHNGYFAQARGSLFVRMALYSAIMG